MMVLFTALIATMYIEFGWTILSLPNSVSTCCSFFYQRFVRFLVFAMRLTSAISFFVCSTFPLGRAGSAARLPYKHSVRSLLGGPQALPDHHLHGPQPLPYDLDLGA